MTRNVLHLTVQGVEVSLAYLHRSGSKPALVCLHGFGSTKEDYADLSMRDDFTDRELLFWDAPGCGASTLSDPDALSIPFLVDVVTGACKAIGVQRFHLSGHSMGGLTALLFAHACPERVLSFINIEGNLAPEDCFLSRQIVDHPAMSDDNFMAGFIERVAARREFGSALYTAALPAKVRASTFKPVFSSMVELSDRTNLMEMIANLACPRIFIYGEQNGHLSYLARLPDLGVDLCKISFSGHFPMYSNAPALWSAMAGFLAQAEALK